MVHAIPDFDPSKQSIPAVRFPKQCGTEDDVTAGRGPSQWGWYASFADHLYRYGKPTAPVSILDVGAGTGTDLARLFRHGYSPFVVGIDPDPRCAIDTVGAARIIVADVAEVPDDAFDFVLCFDVIEHVLDDLVFMANLKRVALSQLWVTTPNWNVSRCGNPHHCRELTPRQFFEAYGPDILWGGPSSGPSHKGTGNGLTMLADSTGYKGEPYGEAKPHLLGVWNYDG